MGVLTARSTLLLTAMAREFCGGIDTLTDSQSPDSFPERWRPVSVSRASALYATAVGHAVDRLRRDWRKIKNSQYRRTVRSGTGSDRSYGPTLGTVAGGTTGTTARFPVGQCALVRVVELDSTDQ